MSHTLRCAPNGDSLPLRYRYIHRPVQARGARERVPRSQQHGLVGQIRRAISNVQVYGADDPLDFPSVYYLGP